ncbi:RNA polymerase, sigma-24 subunit, ECF subfamily [Caldalkalibacillus thermarum TA2.A1]|uniref:RNA polymerase, sigma-24 subunit, ECF subfamily n=1 Tax=Caldalkalibacillus thermarum (strain TA2.A1) TaxID=986075 RepID=F5L962_CALTT|nr:sigma-70 family RNA polymerase sigma factor [Caldalkalibacillus thermarum]EGL82136.1 RNA polymerase, sigma-24 subunit, ECF subfamily [Caldalkalibacillus thermarum TA2.A1]QZT34964.1 sigma-70 family RNA polymerase sigma factor [Caldalkalibacillus thermarum TA2.A1]
MAEREQEVLLLVERVRRGSEEAFDYLYEKYLPFILRIAMAMLKNRQEAEDVCHDIFLEVLNHPERYDPSRGSFESWLAVKTKSKCLDRLRIHKRHLLQEAEEAVNIRRSASFEDPTAEHTLYRELKEALAKALNQIPAAQRQVLLHAYFKGESHRSIAKQLKRPLGTVKSLIRYGLKNMRKQLEEWNWSGPGGGESR